MKKALMLFMFCLSISSSLFAQKKTEEKIQKKTEAYIETVESKITLTSEEKEKIKTLKKEHFKKVFQITTEFKGTPELKVKRKESNKEFSAALQEAFGKERAKEIVVASKKKKKKKQ